MTPRVPKALFLFLFVSVGIFIFSTTAPIQFIVGLAQQTLSYPLSYVYAAKLNEPKQDPEVQKLREENKKLLLQIIDYNTLKKDNQALRGQFMDSSIPTQQLKIAHIVGAQGAASNPTILIIDQGKKSGVITGMAVIYDEQLVGKVVLVQDHFSKVVLVTDPSFSTVGKTTTTKAIGIIKGERDFILFDNVSIKDSLQKEDLLVTKGDINETGIGIPSNIIVGKIRTVAKKENEPFQNAKIEPIIEYKNLTTVFVVLQK